MAGFVDATAGGQINVECQYVLPSQQAACPGYLGDVTLGTLGPDTVGAAYRSGSQAVVAATGTYCWQNNCTPNSNPRQGMPLNDAGFNAAYAAAPGRTKFGNPIYACQLVGGQWFIDLGIATSPPASPVSSP